ncbi:MAG TPA: hypothetical protein VGK09_08275 [Rhodocyclaceae bacterium]|jgi:hypothetical protein
MQMENLIPGWTHRIEMGCSVEHARHGRRSLFIARSAPRIKAATSLEGSFPFPANNQRVNDTTDADPLSPDDVNAAISPWTESIPLGPSMETFPVFRSTRITSSREDLSGSVIPITSKTELLPGSLYDFSNRRLAKLCMERSQCLSVGPLDVLKLSGQQRADPSLRFTETSPKGLLGQASFQKFLHEFDMGIHAHIITFVFFSVNTIVIDQIITIRL